MEHLGAERLEIGCMPGRSLLELAQHTLPQRNIACAYTLMPVHPHASTPARCTCAHTSVRAHFGGPRRCSSPPWPVLPAEPSAPMASTQSLLRRPQLLFICQYTMEYQPTPIDTPMYCRPLQDIDGSSERYQEASSGRHKPGVTGLT